MTNKGVDFEGLRVHTLGYADDAALLDNDIDVATRRVTYIAQGSREDADMEISISKTEVMHVCHQGAVTKTTADEAKQVCTHTLGASVSSTTYKGLNATLANVGGSAFTLSKKYWVSGAHLAIENS